MANVAPGCTCPPSHLHSVKHQFHQATCPFPSGLFQGRVCTCQAHLSEHSDGCPLKGYQTLRESAELVEVPVIPNDVVRRCSAKHSGGQCQLREGHGCAHTCWASQWGDGSIKPAIKAGEFVMPVLIYEDDLLPLEPGTLCNMCHAIDGEHDSWCRRLEAVGRGPRPTPVHKAAVAQQPAPRKTDGPSMHDLVIEDMRDRRTMGLAKYKTLLQTGNGRVMLVDAYQEMLDFMPYLKGALIEWDEMVAAQARQTARIDELVRENADLRARYEARKFKLPALNEAEDGLRAFMEAEVRKQLAKLGWTPPREG